MIVPQGFTIDDLPFAAPAASRPAPARSRCAATTCTSSSTCHGGIQKVKIKTLLDSSRPAAERAEEIERSPTRPAPLESLKGITFNEFDPSDPWIYAGDPFRLQLIRIDSRTGKREVLSRNDRLFNFTVSTDFLPPVFRACRTRS